MERVITIDAAGRLVVPKEMRDRMGLAGGGRLRVVEEGSRLVLEPVPVAPELVEVDGVLVVRGACTGEIPDHRAQRDERADRQWSSS